jgi:hypothetical protein
MGHLSWATSECENRSRGNPPVHASFRAPGYAELQEGGLVRDLQLGKAAGLHRGACVRLILLCVIGLPPRVLAQEAEGPQRVIIAEGETIHISGSLAQSTARASITSAVVERSSTDGYGILIDKCLHTLQIYKDGEPHRRYLDIGVSYPGDKERSGDGRTPEGIFYARLYASSSFGNGKAILLSYPDAEDAAKALGEGIITVEQHDLVVQAQRQRIMPPMWTAVGGSIAVHSDNDQGWYWTTGCPTLPTASITEIYDLLYPVFGHTRNVTIGIIPCDPE